MSHVHTVIEPAGGLTVLVGPNNCGKSALVTALQIVCHGENSTYVTRHNEPECCVRIETADGHVIEWRRRNSPSYLVDGQLFDRLGRGGIPETLHEALRLPRVLGEGIEFDVHFGQQKAPVFLLDKPSSHPAQFFASSSDAARLVEMQKLHQQKLADARKERVRLIKHLEELDADLSVLEPIDTISPNITLLETEYAELRHLAALASQLEQDLHELTRMNRTSESHVAASNALAPLTAPPDVADEKILARLLKDLASETDLLHDAERDRGALLALSPPPNFDQSTELETVVESLEMLQAQLTANDQSLLALAPLQPSPEYVHEAAMAELIRLIAITETDLANVLDASQRLANLQPAPVLDDSNELAKLIQAMSKTVQDVEQMNLEVAEAERLRANAGQELRAFASKQPICPTCGGVLDPDRLANFTHSHSKDAARA